VDSVRYVSFSLYTCTRIFLLRSTVQFTRTVQREQLMLPASSRNLTIAGSKQCSLSMCRSRLSRAENLLLNNIFSRFSRSKFVYDTANVYFT